MNIYRLERGDYREFFPSFELARKTAADLGFNARMKSNTASIVRINIGSVNKQTLCRLAAGNGALSETVVWGIGASKISKRGA